MVLGNVLNGSMEGSKVGALDSHVRLSDERLGVDWGKSGSVCVKSSTASNVPHRKVSIFRMWGIIRSRNLGRRHPLLRLR